MLNFINLKKGYLSTRVLREFDGIFRCGPTFFYFFVFLPKQTIKKYTSRKIYK